MAGARRGARAVLRYYVPLYVLAIIVLLVLAGEGVFGIKKGVKLDDQHSLNAHRDLGFILTEPAALILLVLALLAWYEDRRLRRISIVLPFLLFLQSVFANIGRWGGPFHVLNAFLIMGLLGYLSSALWRGRAAPAGPAESVRSN